MRIVITKETNIVPVPSPKEASGKIVHEPSGTFKSLSISFEGIETKNDVLEAVKFLKEKLLNNLNEYNK